MQCESICEDIGWRRMEGGSSDGTGGDTTRDTGLFSGRQRNGSSRIGRRIAGEMGRDADNGARQAATRGAYAVALDSSGH
jgi:hypothetical protein